MGCHSLKARGRMLQEEVLQEGVLQEGVLLREGCSKRELQQTLGML